MRDRFAFGIIVLFFLFVHCSKAPSTIPPVYNAPLPENPRQDNRTDEQAARDRLEATENLPEIVRILMRMDEDAMKYMEKNNLIAAHQVYEEALDLITIYEGDNDERPREYNEIKGQIFNHFFEDLLKRENIDYNYTDLASLLKDINISEKEDETEAAPPTTSLVTEFPMVMNSRVLQAISYFESTRKGRRTMEVWLERAGKFMPMIFDVFESEGLPSDLAYLCMIESGFRPSVQSRARAVGLWQFIAATGKRYDLKIDGFVDERKDPVKSTQAAARHLKDLYYYWNNDWHIALAAYNVSERRLRQEMRRSKSKNYWDLRRLPSQTRNYIPTFIAAATIAQNPRRYGFEPPVMQAWQFDQVTVDRQASLDVLAKAAGISESAILDLNTELRNWVTPRDNEYSMRLPKGAADKFYANFAAIPDNKLITKVIHIIRPGETISEIARLHRANINQIMLVNNISNPKLLQIGKRLVIPTVNNRSAYERIVASNSSSYGPVVPYDAAQRTKIIYTVKKDDTPSEIAEYFGVGLSKLRAWNNLSRNSFIFPNQKLNVWLPKNSPLAPSQRSGASGTHIVMSGETVEKIGKIYGMSKEEIRDLNSLDENYTIYTNQNLIIRKPKPLPANSSAAQSRTKAIVPDSSPLAPASPKSESGSEFIYKVRPGDTVTDISKLYNVPVHKIFTWNGMTNQSVIYPGDKIKLYIGQTDILELSDAGEHFVYTVQSGDNLWKIARLFETNVNTIQRMNSKINTRIYPGEKLRVPSQQKMPTRK